MKYQPVTPHKICRHEREQAPGAAQTSACMRATWGACEAAGSDSGGLGLARELPTASRSCRCCWSRVTVSSFEALAPSSTASRGQWVAVDRRACLGWEQEVGPFLSPSRGWSEVGWCVSRVSKTRFGHEQVRSRAGRPENVLSHHSGALQGPVGGAICLPRSPSPQEASLPATVPRKDPSFHLYTS